MAMVNENGYVIRRTGGAKTGRIGRRASTRDWWLLTMDTEGRCAPIITSIYFPSKYIGKKIRIKIEVVEDGK